MTASSTKYINVSYFLNPDSTVPLALGETGFNNVQHFFIPCDGFIYRITRVKDDKDVFLDYGTLIGNILHSGRNSFLKQELSSNLQWYRKLDIDNQSIIDAKMAIAPVTFEFTTDKFFSKVLLQTALNNWDHFKDRKQKVFRYVCAYMGES